MKFALKNNGLLQLNFAVLLFSVPSVLAKSEALSPLAIVVGRGGFAAVALYLLLSLRGIDCVSLSPRILPRPQPFKERCLQFTGGPSSMR